MSNKSLEAIEIALKDLNPTAEKLVIVHETESIIGKNIIRLKNDFSVDNVLAQIKDVRYLGIVNSKKFTTQCITALINILTRENKATVIELSSNPVSCKVFYPEPEVGEKYCCGNYEYTYGEASAEFSPWKTKRIQDDWGVRVIDRSQTDYASPLTMIQGYPVSNMSRLFSKNQNTILNLINWDTSNITDMSTMFNNCSAKIINGLTNFDTSKVTNMGDMFNNNQATSLNLTSFNTSNVTNMRAMFANSQVTKLDVSTFNTSNVTNMFAMFFYSQATNLDLSSFDISNVTSMDRMLRSSQVKTLQVKTQTDVDKYKKSGEFPPNITVTIKG